MSSEGSQKATGEPAGYRRGEKPKIRLSSRGRKASSRKDRQSYIKHGNKRHSEEQQGALTENKAKKLYRTIEWQKRTGRLSHEEVLTGRVFERPEFRGVGESMVDLDAAIRNNRLAEAEKLIREGDMEPVREYIRILLLEHMKTLLKEKDGKHFAECVSRFYLYLQGFTLPNELPQEIIEAINRHIAITFQDQDPDNITTELAKFQGMGLLNEGTNKETPELQKIIHDKLLTYFKEQNPFYGKFLFIYSRFIGKDFRLDHETREQLTPLALSWLKNNFENWSQIWEANDPIDTDAGEIDPRVPLVRLSGFLDELQCVSVNQIRRHPGLLKLIRKALVAAQSYTDGMDSINPWAAEGLRSVHRKFWKNPLTRFFARY